jgi:hypothetical protein
MTVETLSDLVMGRVTLTIPPFFSSLIHASCNLIFGEDE